MGKYVTTFVTLSFVASAMFPALASAQSSIDDNLKKIQELTNQIKALQEQIRILQAQQMQLQASSTQAFIEIVASLKQGTSGDQVKILQTLLALDAAIYPEGLITGFFGPATRRAIERFQKRNGLEAVGFVGPRTRALLNQFIRAQFKAAEKVDDDVAEDVAQAIASITIPPAPEEGCAIPSVPQASSTPMIVKDGKTKLIQTGNVFIFQDGKHKVIITPRTYIEKDGKKQLLITPGMRIEKDGKLKRIVSCRATTTPPTPDTTAPIITALAATPASTTAQVTWTTNESATSKVYFGTTTPLALGTALTTSDSSLVMSHALGLSGLTASTTYYMAVESKDASNNTATSSESSFITTN